MVKIRYDEAMHCFGIIGSIKKFFTPKLDKGMVPANLNGKNRMKIAFDDKARTFSVFGSIKKWFSPSKKINTSLQRTIRA